MCEVETGGSGTLLAGAAEHSRRRGCEMKRRQWSGNFKFPPSLPGYTYTYSISTLKVPPIALIAANLPKISYPFPSAPIELRPTAFAAPEGETERASERAESRPPTRPSFHPFISPYPFYSHSLSFFLRTPHYLFVPRVSPATWPPPCCCPPAGPTGTGTVPGTVPARRRASRGGRGPGRGSA